MVHDVILHELGQRVTPVGGRSGTFPPDEVFLHGRRGEMVVVFEATNLLQDGRAAHAQYQRRSSWGKKCALCVCVCVCVYVYMHVWREIKVE